MLSALYTCRQIVVIEHTFTRLDVSFEKSNASLPVMFTMLVCNGMKQPASCTLSCNYLGVALERLVVQLIVLS